MNTDLRLYIKVTTLTLLFGGLAVYGIFAGRHLIQGPIINVESPLNGALVANSFVEIKGNAENISYISLNDRQIFVDEKGNFDEKLLLYPGHSIMKLYAKDRFGREVTKGLSLVYLAQKEVRDTKTDVQVSTTTISFNKK